MLSLFIYYIKNIFFLILKNKLCTVYILYLYLIFICHISFYCLYRHYNARLHSNSSCNVEYGNKALLSQIAFSNQPNVGQMYVVRLAQCWEPTLAYDWDVSIEQQMADRHLTWGSDGPNRLTLGQHSHANMKCYLGLLQCI